MMAYDLGALIIRFGPVLAYCWALERHYAPRRAKWARDGYGKSYLSKLEIGRNILIGFLILLISEFVVQKL